jgi:soluble lytic murein transglycosylase-like protein
LHPFRIANFRADYSRSLLGHASAALCALTLAALMLSPMNAIVRAPVYTRVVAGLRQMVATPGMPSTFETEMAMSPAQLMARWDPLIADAAQRYGVPAAWIRAVMHVESGGRTVQEEDQPITSPAGAVGIMQMMPATYDQMRKQHGLGADPFNPRDSIYASAAYLHWLHGRYGYPNMFAAYNGGPGTLEAYLRGDRALPKETRNYLASVTELVARTAVRTRRRVRYARAENFTNRG